jgi:hypothetical protein
LTAGNLTIDLSDYLPVSGGTLDANSTIDASTATEASTFSGSGLDAVLSANPSSNSTFRYYGVEVKNFMGTMAMSASGLTFPNFSTQSVAYPGSSGFLLKADNLSGLANTTTARTNLGLGSAAVEPATKLVPAGGTTGQVLGKLSNADWDDSWITLPSAPVTSVAGRTGAITLAVADVSGAAPLASPALSGTPTAPTATLGTNTTQIATTAFVLANAPSTSFATDAQVVTGTSTTTSLAPGNAGFLKADPRLRSLAHISYTRVSGSGAVSAGSVPFGIREMFLGSLATGLAGFSYGWTQLASVNMSAADWNKVDFSKKIWMSGTAMCGATLGGTNYIGDSNTRNRVTLGGYASDSVSGDMTVKGIGWKKVGGTSPFFTLTVHNGTTLTDVATSVTQTAGKVINWVIYSDGTGNVTLYIDGVQAATTSAGPTGTSNNFQATYREQVEAVATPTVRAVMECSGGWLYLAD